MAYIHPKTAQMLYLNADKSKVVEEGDPRMAFVLVGPGGTLSDAEAARYGLGVEPEVKAQPKRKEKN